MKSVVLIHMYVQHVHTEDLNLSWVLKSLKHAVPSESLGGK